jgi:endonuclease III
LEAPKRKGRGSKSYDNPHTDFVVMAMEAMQVMRVIMDFCYMNGITIIRYLWEFHLMEGIKVLEPEDLDVEKRSRGMLSCLILSAATTDFEAINGAINLAKAGLLDEVDSMLQVESLQQIEVCIKGCGIHKKRARYLQNAMRKIVEKYGGRVPSTFAGLMDLPGVGRKTASLMLNEAFGFYAGIGTDKHVCHVSLALGFFVPSHGLKNAPPDHVEKSLKTWIERQNYKETNRIFGGMAQLVTQKLANLQSNDHSSKRKEKNLTTLLDCITNRFNGDKELEIAWFIFARIRQHYNVVIEKRESKMSNATNDEEGEESDDEDDEEMET